MGRQQMEPAELTLTTRRTAADERLAEAAGRAAVGTTLFAPVLQTALALLILTALGALLAQEVPALAPTTRPHPTLHSTPGAIVAILANNARVLAVPFILTAALFARTRPTRLLGDLIVAAILAGNALWIGLAIGRWQGALVPYIPQLPMEYLAASTAAAAWIHSRRQARSGAGRHVTLIYASATAVLLVSAAGAEVLLTPHAR